MISVFRGWAYFFRTSSSSPTMILRMRAGFFSVSSKSSISSASEAVSCTRLRMYSLLILRSLISATYSACTWSMPKPIIRLGTTSASSSVWRMISMALSMSSKMRLRPCSRCSFSCFLCRMKYTRRRTHSVRHASHSSNSSRTPRTLGIPAMRMLKLQLTVSCRGVRRKSFCMSLSGSAPRLRSTASFRPDRSVSSRISLISLIFPAFISSETLSRMASREVE